MTYLCKWVFANLHIPELRRSRNPLRPLARASLSELSLSIKNLGLLEPIIVRTVNDGYEIVAGHRRIEACKLLGMIRITFHIMEIDDKEAYEISLIENVQKKSMNPTKEASAFQKYIHTFGWGGESDLARRIGKSQVYVSRRISLLKLPPSVQQKILDRDVSTSLAQELYGLNEEQIEKVIEDVAMNGYNNKEAREMIKTIRRNPDLGNKLKMHEERYGIASTLASLSREDEEEDAKRRTKYLFQKCKLSTRIALKSLDNVLDDFEEESYKAESTNDYFWFAKELVMQHRIMLAMMAELPQKISTNWYLNSASARFSW